MTIEMGSLFPLVWIAMMENAHALQDSKVMVLKIVKILMNVRRRRHANAMNATAKTHGAVTSAVVAAVCCISRTMIPASVRILRK